MAKLNKKTARRLTIASVTSLAVAATTYSIIKAANPYATYVTTDTIPTYTLAAKSNGLVSDSTLDNYRKNSTPQTMSVGDLNINVENSLSSFLDSRTGTSALFSGSPTLNLKQGSTGKDGNYDFANFTVNVSIPSAAGPFFNANSEQKNSSIRGTFNGTEAYFAYFEDVVKLKITSPEDSDFSKWTPSYSLTPITGGFYNGQKLIATFTSPSQKYKISIASNRDYFGYNSPDGGDVVYASSSNQLKYSQAKVAACKGDDFDIDVTSDSINLTSAQSKFFSQNSSITNFTADTKIGFFDQVMTPDTYTPKLAKDLMTITLYAKTNTKPEVTLTQPANVHYNKTEGTSMTVSGTATDADGNLSYVNLSINGGTPIKITNINPDGTWAYTFNTKDYNMVPGTSYSVEAQAFDTENESSGVDTKSFQLTNTAPTVAVTQPANVQYRKTSAAPSTLTGQVADADNDPCTVTVTVDNKAPVVATVSGNTWTAVIDTNDLAVGNHTITVNAIDSNDSPATPQTTTLTVDNTPPTISASNMPTSVTEEDPVTPTLTIGDINEGQILTYQYQWDGGAFQNFAPNTSTTATGVDINIGTVSIPTTGLTPGQNHKLVIKVSDGIAEAKTSESTIMIDHKQQAPVLTLKDIPAQQYTEKTNEVSTSGTVSDINGDGGSLSAILENTDKTITIEPNVFTNGNGQYNIKFDSSKLPIGDYILKVVATDDTNLSSEKTTPVKIVNTAPTVQIKTLASQWIYGEEVPCSLTIGDINDGQTLTYSYRFDDTGDWITAGTIKSTGSNQDVNFNLNTTSLQRNFGTHKVSFMVNDGFEDAQTPAIQDGEFLPEPTAPTVEVSSVEEQQYTNRDNIIEFTVKTYDINGDDVLLTAKFNGTTLSPDAIESLTATGESNIGTYKNFKISINTKELPISDDNYTLEVTATDATNLSSTASSYVKIVNTAPTIKATVPTAPIYDVDGDLKVSLALDDINYGQDMTVSYCVDDGEWIETNIKYVNDGPTTQELSIPLTASMKNKVNYFKFKVNDTIVDTIDDGDGTGYPVDIRTNPSLTTGDQPDQQYTVKDNYVSFNAKTEIYDSIKISAKFNGIDVPQENISERDNEGNFTITVNTASMDVKPESYILEITASDNDKTFTTKEAKVRVVNTKPSIDAQIPDKEYIENKNLQTNFTLNDINNGQTITVEYSFDNTGIWQEANISYITDGEIKNFTDGIDISSLKPGKHTVRFRAYDGIEYGYDMDDENKEQELPFEVWETPRITVGEILPQEFTTEDNLVEVKCSTVTYPKVQISATFNGSEVSDSQISEVDADGNFIITLNTKSLPVKTDGGYLLDVTVSDGENEANDSNIVKIKNTAPVPTINDIITKKVKKAQFNITVDDVNVGQNIDVYYSIDNSPSKLALTSYTNPSTKTKTYAFELDILKTLPKGQHTITIYANDGIEESMVQKAFEVYDPYSELGQYASDPEIAIESAPDSIRIENDVVISYSVLDEDIGDTLTITRSIDNNPGEKIAEITSTGERTIKEDNLGKLTAGTHTITYTVTDVAGHTSSTSHSLKVISNHNPELSIKYIPPEIYHGNKFDVKLNLFDEDVDQDEDIYYSIDDGSEILAATIKSKGKEQEVTITMPDDISIGDHKLTFWAIDEDGGYSNVDDDIVVKIRSDGTPDGDGNVTTVDVNNNPPTVEVVSKPDSVEEGENFTIRADVRDKDKGQKVKVYYQVDNMPEVLVDEFTSDGNKKPEDITIKGLPAGTYTIRIFAVDELGAKSEITTKTNVNIFGFANVGNNDKLPNEFTIEVTPKFVNTPPTCYITSNKKSFVSSDDIKISLAAGDVDKGQKVKVYYQIENEETNDITSFISNGDIRDITATIPKLVAGDYIITFWSEDELGAKSNDDGNLFINDNNDGDDSSNIKGNKIRITVYDPIPEPEDTTPIVDEPIKEVVKTGVEDTNKTSAGIIALVVGSITALASTIILKKKK